MRDSIATPVLSGLAIGIAFVVILSVFLGPAIDYIHRNDIIVTRVPPGYYYQPWLEPRTGIPHLWITDVLVSGPDIPKANYDDALWIQRAMDSRGNLATVDKSINIGQGVRIGTVIMLDDSELESYFDFYRQAKTDNRFVQVSFPDAPAKYYDVCFIEVP